MKPGMGVLKALGLTTLLVCGTQTAFAQDYPARNITVVVPFPAGGPSDVVARIVAEAMGRTLGHTLVIENVAGAGGTIGSARVATASPDGYTLLAGSMGSHVAAPVLTPNMKYDPAKDFIAIGPTAHSPAVVVARKDFPAKDLKEFADYARRNKTSLGTYGAGSYSHCAVEGMNRSLGLKMEAVHYRGEAPMWIDVASGAVQGGSGSVAAATSVLQSGAGRPIAVPTKVRMKKLPDVPTFYEQGFTDKALQLRGWVGAAAPAGTPRRTVLSGSRPRRVPRGYLRTLSRSGGGV